MAVSAQVSPLWATSIAEPKALIGFAGPRVIESTVRVTLPEGFQRAEFLMQKGAVDMICDRRELRVTGQQPGHAAAPACGCCRVTSQCSDSPPGAALNLPSEQRGSADHHAISIGI